jgi:hypothetical protein
MAEERTSGWFILMRVPPGKDQAASPQHAVGPFLERRRGAPACAGLAGKRRNLGSASNEGTKVMGEAKRRRERRWSGPPGSKMLNIDAPEIRELVEEGQPINLYLIGSGIILPTLLPLSDDERATPQYRPVRMVFSVFDRIRTGEIAPWQCFLCAREFYGPADLSVLAFIERTLGEPLRTKPALITPICHSCDSVSTEETRRRVEEAFGLWQPQEGHA